MIWKGSKQSGITIDEATAIEEVVADACEMMLKDTRAVETLAEKDHGLFVHVRNWLRKFYGQLKQAFNGLAVSRLEAIALTKEDKDGTIRYIEGLQELWDQALVDAVEGGREYKQEHKVKYALRDSSGNVIDLTKDAVEENKRYVANMEPVAVLEGNPMGKNPDKDFETMGIEYFASIGGKAVNPILGDIALDKDGIGHLIGRKLTWRKAALLRAVKPVLEQGRILFIDNDHKGGQRGTAIVSATVVLDGIPYYMGVVVSQNKEKNNRYELHDAIVVQKNNKNATVLTKTPSVENKAQTRGDDSVPSVAIILSELADYNTELLGEEKFSLRSPIEETDTMYQARDYSALSEREILAGADPNVFKNAGSRAYLQRYQAALREREKLQDKLTGYQEEALKEGISRADREAAEARAKIAETQLARQEEKLTKLEGEPEFQRALAFFNIKTTKRDGIAAPLI